MNNNLVNVNQKNAADIQNTISCSNSMTFNKIRCNTFNFSGNTQESTCEGKTKGVGRIISC